MSEGMKGGHDAYLDGHLWSHWAWGSDFYFCSLWLRDAFLGAGLWLQVSIFAPKSPCLTSDIAPPHLDSWQLLTYPHSLIISESWTLLGSYLKILFCLLHCTSPQTHLLELDENPNLNEESCPHYPGQAVSQLLFIVTTCLMLSLFTEHQSLLQICVARQLQLPIEGVPSCGALNSAVHCLCVPTSSSVFKTLTVPTLWQHHPLP